MAEHEQFAGDLALYSLNALSGEERTSLEKHLSTCAACRTELEQLRGDGALLAISVEGAKPPLRARQRLMAAVAREPRLRVTGRRSWWGAVGWAATAVVFVFAFFLWKENSALKQNESALELVIDKQTAELEQAQRVVATLTAPDGIRATLVAAKSAPQPQGKVFYVRSQGSLVFLANNMPALPPQKAYELWLIPVNGAPIPAGVFKPDAHGNASVLNPPLRDSIEAKAFAITLENDAGSSTPTMPILMVGVEE